MEPKEALGGAYILEICHCYEEIFTFSQCYCRKDEFS